MTKWKDTQWIIAANNHALFIYKNLHPWKFIMFILHLTDLLVFAHTLCVFFVYWPLHVFYFIPVWLFFSFTQAFSSENKKVWWATVDVHFNNLFDGNFNFQSDLIFNFI